VFDGIRLPLTLTLSPGYDSTELVEVRGEGIIRAITLLSFHSCGGDSLDE
jgi:hypothetical protein